jgi:hypothetical protein
MQGLRCLFHGQKPVVLAPVSHCHPGIRATSRCRLAVLLESKWIQVPADLDIEARQAGVTSIELAMSRPTGVYGAFLTIEMRVVLRVGAMAAQLFVIPGAPQTGNHRVRSDSTGTYSSMTFLTASSRRLSLACPASGAKGYIVPLLKR